MPKRTTTLPLTLPPREPGAPAGRWLVNALCAEIVEGRLKPGSRLPATRDLALQYGLSRGTVVAAFDRLMSEGYLEGRVGAGSFVSRVLPDRFLAPRRGAAVGRSTDGAARGTLARGIPVRRPLLRDLAGYEPRPPRAFRANTPALDLFPVTIWAQVTGRRLRRATPSQLLGCDAAGYQPLRQAVAEYLATSRGVRCTADQVVVVSGTQEALDLTARVLVRPGDRALVEDPGYDGAVAAFEAHGARVTGVAVDGEGMVVPPARARGARLAYVTPAHQFPLGVSMSLRRRLEVLDWARRSGTLVVEDDYDSEYRYAGRPLPALQGLDRDGLILLAGSFSKVLFPALRLGYLVVPETLVDAFRATKSVASRHAPLLDQAVLCDFITAGHFGRHIRRMREIYAERLGVLLAGVRERLAGSLAILDVEAGLQAAALLPTGTDDERVAAAAAARGIEVIPLSRYARAAAGRAGLQLGFAAVDPDGLRRGIEGLADILGTV
jgi:GntR family transcriptional regulator/MocR family aminotransferase